MVCSKIGVWMSGWSWLEIRGLVEGKTVLLVKVVVVRVVGDEILGMGRQAEEVLDLGTNEVDPVVQIDAQFGFELLNDVVEGGEGVSVAEKGLQRLRYLLLRHHHSRGWWLCAPLTHRFYQFTTPLLQLLRY